MPILDETVIPLGEVAPLVPMPVCANTIYRWANVGVSTTAGGTVKLETVRIGGRLITSKEAVGRFVKAQVGPTTGTRRRRGKVLA